MLKSVEYFFLREREWLFLCRVLCNWLLDHGEPFPVFSSVVFGADV